MWFSNRRAKFRRSQQDQIGSSTEPEELHQSGEPSLKRYRSTDLELEVDKNKKDIQEPESKKKAISFRPYE